MMRSSAGHVVELVPTKSSASVSERLAAGGRGTAAGGRGGRLQAGPHSTFPVRSWSCGSCWTRARRGGAAADRSAGLLTAGGGAAGMQRDTPKGGGDGESDSGRGDKGAGP